MSKTVLNDYPTVEGAGPATHLLEMLARARRRSGAVTIGVSRAARAERRTNLRSADPFRQRGPLPDEFFLEEEW
ncbi:MAG: hypothetical protein HKL89_06860 [Candidatus Dormibacteraeota bacterium]|nr:hypothetical protein [Candidatus Dormibacteraeota bacterium]